MPYQEAVVAHIADLQDGTMKQVTVGDTDVLLARIDGQYHAVGAACTHYGAPLAKGILTGTRVVCPWHHSCFSVVTGDLQEPPSLDALPRYSVRLDGDQVIVRVPAEQTDQRLPELVAPDPADERQFVIVGSGAAGVAAAEALREAAFRGRIVLLTADEQLPYDRTLLSKDYLAKEEDKGWIPMRSAEFYTQHGVDVRVGVRVTRLDAAAQELTLADGGTVRYDALLLAPGSAVQTLDVPGATLKGVELLRTLADAERIVAAAKASQRAVVVGASWIGMECAASLRERKVDVTVVSPDAVPFERTLGRDVGEMFQGLHAEQGVAFRFEAEVTGFDGADQVTGVVLDTGETLPADLVVVGIGVHPATDAFDALPRNDDGSFSVDEHMRVVGASGPIYAAGDSARYPDPTSGKTIRVEHWRVAMQQGRTAAFNMAGQSRVLDDAPFFWTQQYGTSFRYAGNAEEWDEIVVDGDLQARDALVYYIKDERLRAAFGVQRDAAICAIRECMRQDALPPIAAVRAKNVDWQQALREHGA